MKITTVQLSHCTIPVECEGIEENELHFALKAKSYY